MGLVSLRTLPGSRYVTPELENTLLCWKKVRIIQLPDGKTERREAAVPPLPIEAGVSLLRFR